MEVEELSQSEDKNNAISNSQVDVDSGIENMEVEESKESTQQRVRYCIIYLINYTNTTHSLIAVVTNV